MTLCSLPKLQSMSTNKRLEILRKFTEAHLTSPEILRQPDYEQMEWFNDILKLLWPSLCDYTKREIFSKVVTEKYNVISNCTLASMKKLLVSGRAWQKVKIPPNFLL